VFGPPQAAALSDNPCVAIRNFEIGPIKGLRKAEAHDVPNLMGIAGPNGSGKSSLLEGLRQRRHELLEPNSELLYIGPHRTWRSSDISRVAAYGFTMDTFLDVLRSDNLPSFQYGMPGNLQMLQGIPRLASSADDAQAYIKTAIIRLFDKQRELVTGRWEANDGEVAKGTVPTLFGPLQRLVTTLLPHLEWLKVDDTNKDNIRCLFQPITDPTLQFDIDDLSSGEKAAIALFLPFIEKQALALANSAEQGDQGVVPLAVLVDEPEIHLHPLLQLNVLDYMRSLARDEEAQFIFTTHSPTMLDALTEDELWLLSPAALVQDNQLVRLTNSHEQLEVARVLTGATHMLTRGKPIVFVEGESDVGSAVTDERILRLLLPDTKHWAIVPAREKRGVVEAASRLRAGELALPGQPVFGLVDADRDNAGLPDYIISWPVAMIENLLLDPDAIYTVVAGFEAVTGLRGAQDVRRSLDVLARARRDEEVSLRVQAALPVGRIALKPEDVNDAKGAVTAVATEYLERLGHLDITAVAQRAEAEVDRIMRDGEMLERFHGKRMLEAFQQSHSVARAGFSKGAFATKVAVACAGGERSRRLAGPAVSRIRLFFPAALAGLIAHSAVSDEHVPERDELARLCKEERESWERNAPTGDGRDGLRQRVFAFAHQLAGGEREQLALEGSRIGTP
jgi:ABC-type cobalamin/Fe3+-siderophores transport system ATPase subunit